MLEIRVEIFFKTQKGQRISYAQSNAQRPAKNARMNGLPPEGPPIKPSFFCAVALVARFHCFLFFVFLLKVFLETEVMARDAFEKVANQN